MRLVWKNNPLNIHNFAMPAAMAAMAANEQGKFWDYHEKLFANQGKFQPDQLLQYAKEIGLNEKKFQSDSASAKSKTLIDADVAEANSLGATGTPAFFINGRYLSGAQPFPAFAQIINAELQRQNIPVPPAALAGGAPPPPATK